MYNKKVLTFLIISMAFISQVHAKFVFFGWGDEKIIKVIDLPDINDLYNPSEATYVDLGYRFQQVNIFFVPVWNYNGQWCGYIGKDDMYIPMTEGDWSAFFDSQVFPLISYHGLSFPDKPKLPFWDEYGGKLLIGIILALFLYFTYFVKDENDLELVEDDNIEKLTKLAKLKEQGHITEEEFNKKKEELLS